jgi:hypothetical protein
MLMEASEAEASVFTHRHIRSSPTRGAAQEIRARQIDLICHPQLISAEGGAAVQNGGDVRSARCCADYAA